MLSIVFYFLALGMVCAQYTREFKSKHRICGFSEELSLAEIDYEEGDPQTKSYVERICALAGIENKFNIVKAPIKTAASTYDDDLGRFIFYSVAFFAGENSLTSDVDERKILILAHEVGHFLNNDILPNGPGRLEDELNADRFAGSILCKMSLSLASSSNFLTEVCGASSGKNYPSLAERKKALAEGFRRANCKGDYAPPAFERDEVMTLLRQAFPNSIFFDYDTNTLDSLYYPLLDSLANRLKLSGKAIYLKAYSSMAYLDITGTNVVNTAAYALSNSQNIGRCIHDYLIHSGVSAAKIRTKAYGANGTNKFQVNPNSEFGRQVNRRVDLEVVDAF